MRRPKFAQFHGGRRKSPGKSPAAPPDQDAPCGEAGVRNASAEVSPVRAVLLPILERAASLLASPRAFAVALMLAVVLRIVHLAAFSATPFALAPVLDHQAYDQWAQRIAAGGWIGTGVFWVDPLYAYWLAILYSVFGHQFVVARVAQLAMGVANVALAGALTKGLTGSRAASTAAMLIGALYIPAIHNEVQLEKATLSTLLFSGLLVLFLRHPASMRATVATGLLAGLAILTRGSLALVVAAGVLAAVLTRSADDPGMPGEPGPWLRLGKLELTRGGVRRAGLLFLGAAAVVGSLTARNVLLSGEVVPTTANVGQNLYIGQVRSNLNGTYHAPEFVRPDPQHEQDDFRAEAERRTGHAMSVGEVSAFWRKEALAEIAADPGAFVVRSIRKVWLVFHDFEVPDNDDIDVAALYSPVMRSPFFRMGQIAPLALLGAIVSWRRSREVATVTGAIAVYAASMVAFFVLARFRILLFPALVALAVVGGQWLINQVREGFGRKALGGVAFLVGALLVCNIRPAWMEQMRTESLAISCNNLAAQLVQSGDEDGAIAMYEKAVATSPQSVLASMRTLGDLYLKRKDYERAEKHMRAVLDLRPGSARAKQALVLLYEAMARDSKYSSDGSVSRRLSEARRAVGSASGEGTGTGTDAVSSEAAARSKALMGESRAHRSAGRWKEGIATLQEAIRIGPYSEDARYLLGSIMERHATAEEMVTFWSTTLERDQKPQTSLYFWAVGIEGRGDIPGAIEKLQEALRRDPAHEMSELRLCGLLERQGKLSDALTHCDRAVDIFPEYRAAHEARARVLDALGRTKEAQAARDAGLRSDPNTTRRFRYWGQYLMRAGRYEAAIPELERALVADPNDAEAAKALGEARERAPAVGSTATTAGSSAAWLAGSPSGGIDDATLKALSSALSEAPSGSPVWITATAVDPASQVFARALARAFADAGWEVQPMGSVEWSVRRGVHIFSADGTPPSYVGTAQRALEAAGFTPSFAVGYREYYEQRKREQPDFRGFLMAPGQSFVLVVGRRQ